jgi:predicted RNA-binding protein associated with RNAse of E/G family
MCPREPGGGGWLRLPRDPWELGERIWEDTHALSFAWPGRPHAVLLMWDASWTPRSWYVNLQDPLLRTPLGFDYLDLALDVIVALDRSTWSWKDEDELAEAVGRGVVSEERAAGLRPEAEALVRRILDGEPPFDRDWVGWRPDPSWGVPELPRGWDAAG